ncbi:ClpX C4-type zinc finger protein [Sinorhizobium fredii]|uniref:ClpX C4-type zinc finger protein n=1 Tax=Rhizobium fredii TaxID=380 RepID=UPI00055C6128
MSELRLSIAGRLRAARRILFGRGDNAIVCSFCGEDRHGGARNIVTGPDVAICGKCAQTASDWCALASLKPQDGNEIDTFPIFKLPASLLPSFRAHIAQEL